MVPQLGPDARGTRRGISLRTRRFDEQVVFRLLEIDDVDLTAVGNET